MLLSLPPPPRFEQAGVIANITTAIAKRKTGLWNNCFILISSSPSNFAKEANPRCRRWRRALRPRLGIRQDDLRGPIQRPAGRAAQCVALENSHCLSRRRLDSIAPPAARAAKFCRDQARSDEPLFVF